MFLRSPMCFRSTKNICLFVPVLFAGLAEKSNGNQLKYFPIGWRGLYG